MKQMLGEVPWYVLAGLAIIALLLMNVGRQSRNRRTVYLGVALAVLGLALALVSHLIQTPREQALAGTREIAEAVEQGKYEALQNSLASDTTLTALGVPIYPNREKIVQAARSAKEPGGMELGSVTITRSDTRVDGPYISVSLDVTTVQKATLDRPVATGWLFEWMEQPDGTVKLREIRLVNFQNQSVEEAAKHFPRPKQP